MSASTSPSRRSSTRKRPVPVTVPMTEAAISHLAQIASRSSSLAGSTMASIRSWLSLIISSNGSRPASRTCTSDRYRSMPTPPLDEVSLAAPVIPAAPRSWIPTTSPASRISRQASISRFSSKGSPTCTLGRFSSSALLEGGRCQHAGPADAVSPRGRTEQHREVPRARRPGEGQPVLWQHAEAEHVHQWIAPVGGIEDGLAADGGDAHRVAVTRHARHHALPRSSGCGDRRADRSAADPSGQWAEPPSRRRRAGCRPPRWRPPRRARWPRGGCGSRCGTRPRCRRPRRPRPRPLPGRPTRGAPPTAAGAGAGARTCTSSAPTTSPSTWRARGGSAVGRGCRRSARPRRRSAPAPGGRQDRGAQRVTPWRQR